MSGDLKWNKIFGAGLATAFVIVGVQQVSSMIYATHAPEQMGYLVEVAETPDGGEVVLPPDWGTLLPVADLAAGQAAFARCQTCHTITPGGANGTGPSLYGVVGGPVLHAAGFAYSPGMQAHRDAAPVWTYDELDQFLTAPGRHVPGTKMSFAGIRDQTTRVNLIAWMRDQGSSGYAIPAPDPARQPGATAPAEGEAAPAEGEAAAEAPATEAAAPAAH